MKRHVPLRRRKGLRRLSSKRRAAYQTYLGLRRYFLTRNPYCEFPSDTGAPTCMKEATEIHHKKGRAGELLCDIRWFMAVCDSHHKFIEDHKKWARERKLILYK